MRILRLRTANITVDVMPPVISRDLKARIPILHLQQGFKVKDVCKLLGVQKSLVYQVLHNHRRYGQIQSPTARFSFHRHRLLAPSHVEFIRLLLRQHHTLYLDEIQAELHLRHGVYVSISTLMRTLRRLHFSNKRVSVKALERDELRRAVFMNRIGAEVPDPWMLMFTDESAKNDRTYARRYGWSKVGTRCVQRQCFICGKRYSILPVLTLDSVITYDIIEGSVTSERFIRFLRELVVFGTHFLSEYVR